MRILHIIHQYPPEFVGGTELYTKSIAERQAETGHDVSIFVPSARSSGGLQPVDENGVSVYRSPGLALGAAARFASSYRNTIIESHFREIVSGIKPDIVHVQHMMGLPPAVVSTLLKARIPYVLTLHDYWYICANAQLLTNYDESICDGPNLWLNCARCGLARLGFSNLAVLSPLVAPIFAIRDRAAARALSGARRLIAPTQFVCDLYVSSGTAADTIAVIPHGIDPPDELPRKKMPLKDAVAIGYVGGLSRQKGIHVLIEAVNGLPEGKVTLAIWGDTEAFPTYVDDLRLMARHKGIIIEGLLPRQQFWSKLAEFDLVVVPSLWYETASLIIQEAFAAGVPVIASDIGALTSRIQDGRDGILVPPGDPAALREVLKNLVDNPQMINRLQSGIQPVLTTMEHVELLEELYHSELSG